jgi:hypothetical protein
MVYDTPWFVRPDLVEAAALSDALLPGDKPQFGSLATSESLESKFNACAEVWRAQTRHMSSITKMTSHPAYREIIKMGEAAVPLILRELANRPDHWFAALHEITGHDPVPKNSQGRLGEMTESWLDWGRRHGYIS